MKTKNYFTTLGSNIRKLSLTNYLKFFIKNKFSSEITRHEIFDQIILLILLHKKEIFNFTINGGIPTIYYLGMGKTGSAAIKRGFKKHCTAHWHQTAHFERKYKTKLLSDNNYDLLDLIKYIGKRFNFKPLIIECIREPISKSISSSFQHLKYNKKRKYCKCDLCVYKNKKKSNFNLELEKNNPDFQKIIHQKIKPLNIKKVLTHELLVKHFNFDIVEKFDINKKFIIKDFGTILYVLCRFEEINDRKKLFNSIGYNYSNIHTNKTTPNTFKITISEEKINDFYNEYTRAFYSYEEFQNLSQKYI